MKTFIFAILLSTNAFANGIYLGGWSHHLSTDGLNEHHSFVAVEHKNVIVGTFENSYSNRSVMVAYNWGYHFGNDIGVGAWVGVTTGYDCDEIKFPCIAGVLPAVVPYVTFKGFPVQPVVALFGEALLFTVKVEF